MSYYPPPQGGFYPPSNPGYQPGKFPPDDHYTPSGEYQPPGSYPQPGLYLPPGQYPMPGQYPLPGQYPHPGEYQPPSQYGLPGPYGQPYGVQSSSAIVNQPTSQNLGDWTNTRQGLPNCPPGLECLMPVSSLFVKQKVELLEAFTGYETKNKFTIKNKQGDKLYYAVEKSDCCTRNLCGPLRSFDMKIMDAYKNEIIHVHRPFRCDSCWFPCCLQQIEVSAPPGNVIGTIEQEWSIFKPKFLIKDAVGETVLKVQGSFCTFSLCGSVEFKVLSRDEQYEVGKISKEWSGFVRELFTDADYFGISFPEDLDVRMKAVMIGAVFLIDAMFFEKQGNKERDRPGML